MEYSISVNNVSVFSATGTHTLINDWFAVIPKPIGTSADIVLCDVLKTGYEVKNSLLNDKLKTLNKEDLSRIYEVLDAEIKHSKLK